MKPTNLIVIGGFGRFGSAVLEAVDRDPGIHLKAIVVERKSLKERRRHHARLATDLAQVAGAGDVVLDVSAAESVRTHVKKAAKAGAAYILAVTGIDPKTRHDVDAAAAKIPVIVAPNLSLGVAVLKELTILATLLVPDADVEIVEAHHRNKLDAPSGTALMLASEIVDAKEREQKFVLGRSQRGAREMDSIGIHAVRGGDVVGEHRVHFLLDGERLELAHAASTREIFARGAMKAVKFISDSRPGMYTMRDVLGLGRMRA